MAKFSLIARLQHWMDSVPGQTFMNYAYSWGAAVVILGTLFKLTHIPGANAMLFIGMGTEVFVFFIAGFDRPFDAKKDVQLADEFVDLEDMPEHVPAQVVAQAQTPTLVSDGEAIATGATVSGGGTVVIGGGSLSAADAANLAAASAAAAGAAASMQNVQNMLDNADAINAPEVEEATESYLEQLKKLTEALAKMEAQAERMSADSEEMTQLNRNLTGINTIYEMQLKSISQQVGTIDEINDQTRRMAKQIEELNAVYARMIEALTVNMPKTA